MLYDEFKDYLESNASRTLDQFLEKVTLFEQEKNKTRGKKRWNEAKVQRVIDMMYDQLISNAYEKIKAEKGVPKYNGTEIWIDFMTKHDFLDMFAESIDELEIE